MGTISENLGRKVLKKRVKKLTRNKAAQNFKSAGSAVIVFDALLKDSFPAIKDFTKFLNSEGIKTSVIGYCHQKAVPQEMLLWANFEFITKKDVNWLGRPSNDVADKYFREEPDMLFVLSFKNHLSIEYLVQLSKAKFKVGCFTEENNDLDLMINPPAGKCDVVYFLEQVKHYITVINPS